MALQTVHEARMNRPKLLDLFCGAGFGPLVKRTPTEYIGRQLIEHLNEAAA